MLIFILEIKLVILKLIKILIIRISKNQTKSKMRIVGDDVFKGGGTWSAFNRDSRSCFVVFDSFSM